MDEIVLHNWMLCGDHLLGLVYTDDAPRRFHRVAWLYGAAALGDMADFREGNVITTTAGSYRLGGSWHNA